MPEPAASEPTRRHGACSQMPILLRRSALALCMCIAAWCEPHKSVSQPSALHILTPRPPHGPPPLAGTGTRWHCSLPGVAVAGNDHVGWGFEKAGGFPANPWQHTYAMNRSTAAYFVGNASGAHGPAGPRGSCCVRPQADLLTWGVGMQAWTARPSCRGKSSWATLAVGETVILLISPLPSVGVSIVMERGCQQNDSLADG